MLEAIFRGAPKFMELNNKNKHEQLVPQIIQPMIDYQQDGLIVKALALDTAEGGSIRTVGGTVKGPLKITPDNIAEYESFGIFQVKGWKAIYIDGYNVHENALAYTQCCIMAVRQIVIVLSSNIPQQDFDDWTAKYLH